MCFEVFSVYSEPLKGAAVGKGVNDTFFTSHVESLEVRVVTCGRK